MGKGMRIGLLTICLGYVTSAFALDPLLSLRVGEAESKLSGIEKFLLGKSAVPHQDLQLLDEYIDQGNFVKKISNECIETNESAINKSAGDLDLLGPQGKAEDPQVTSKRQSLNLSMLSNAQQLASCRLMLLRVQDSIERLNLQQQQILKSELLARSGNLLENFKHVILNPAQIGNAALDFTLNTIGWQHIRQNIKYFIALTLLGLSLLYLFKRIVQTLLQRHAESHKQGYLGQFQLSLLACFNRYLPVILFSAIFSAWYLYQWLYESHLYSPGLLVSGLLFYSLINLFIRVLLNPCPPARRLTGLEQDVSELLARRLRLLSKLLLAGYLMYSALQIYQFPESITRLLHNLYLFLLVLNLIWAIWLLRYHEGFSKVLLLRSLIILALVVCLIADWLGYVNLADYLLIGIVGSMVGWFVTVFIIQLWTDLLDGLDEGRSPWQQHLRKRIGVKSGDFMPGSIWFRLVFAIISWSLFLVGMLKLWGLPDSTLQSLRDIVVVGFQIGSVTIQPLKVILALLGFAVMLSMVGWVRRRMDKSWLNRTRMDRGSKEAMISLTGYLGVAIAFLIALSLAGFELANIALIAGALSVGIGFGLQNIVNNFVSGLILLFERPIKTGDWVVVSGTEGYVKKISIRSTQIQTFDRSDVIVPNSQLISEQVTNWMFRDSIGRIKVPIGVAYGTDTEKVKEILLDIAYQQDFVITQSPILGKPWVLFTEFGDSSLNFELRCYIKEVDSRMHAISEINFAIDKAFRAAGIEIPFPQRDVHIIKGEE